MGNHGRGTHRIACADAGQGMRGVSMLLLEKDSMPGTGLQSEAHGGKGGRDGRARARAGRESLAGRAGSRPRGWTARASGALQHETSKRRHCRSRVLSLRV